MEHGIHIIQRFAILLYESGLVRVQTLTKSVGRSLLEGILYGSETDNSI